MTRAKIHDLDGHVDKELIVEGHVRLCETNNFIPWSMITLTIRPGEQLEKQGWHWEKTASGIIHKVYDRSCGELPKWRSITDQELWWKHRFLIRRTNEFMGGKNYRRMWGRSYFGNYTGLDYHKSGESHLHMLVDNWVPFKFIHETWNRIGGYAHTKILDDTNRISQVRYVVKYATKGSEMVDYFFQKERRQVDKKTGRIIR